MKRFAKAMLAACMTAAMLFALTACNKGGDGDEESKTIDIEGKWAKTVNTKEVTTDSGVQFYKSYLEDNSLTWTVKSDGTLKIEISSKSNGDSSIDAKWSADGNTVTVVDPTAMPDKQRTYYTYNPDDGKIYYNDEAEKVYCLEKK